ncbi:MAG: T9SS type A sorting domain-containing protein [Flavipsychrobacter sp.]
MQLKHLTIALLLTIACITPQKSSAAGAAGGEIIYEWLGDSTYRFFFALDQACGNGAEPTTIPLCFYNTCTNSRFTRTMTKYTGTPPSTASTNRCPNVTTNCNSITSTIQGYKTFWYATIETLPIRCQWKISTLVAGRNPATNNIDTPTNTGLYIELYFNNTIALNNSSPYYSKRSLQAVYRNRNFTINYEAKDADGDSIVTEIIHPLTSTSSCSTPTNVTYTIDTPAINIPNNPFQTGSNNFSLNPFTGLHSFTSTDTGGNSYAIRTSEYRNGVLIGSIMKEAQIQTFQPPSNFQQPVLKYKCGQTRPNLVSNGTNACIGQQLSFCFDLVTSTLGSVFRLTDNHNTTLPNANITYTRQNSDSVHVEFSWTPTTSDVGYQFFIFTVIDSSCSSPGIISTYGHVIPFYVWPAVKASSDTIINAGERALLGVTGGGNYTWAVLSGTANSLNNTNIANPIATPTTTTSYVVSSGVSNFCNNSKDTVTVTVRPPHIGTAGGEMIYEHLADSTYRFFVKLYQDCTSGSAPDSIPICLRDTCNNITLSYLMPQWQGSTGGNTPHSGGNLSCGTKTTCDSMGATVPGYKVHWYYKIVTLPSKCNSWRASTYLAGRNANSKNILSPTVTPFYLEATFNNNISNNNSSPYYSVGSIPYTFTNTTTTYNAGAIDVDGDSLVTEIIHPLTGVTNCSDTPVAVTYQSMSPAISIPSNPFQTGTTNFALNPTTGLTSFTSTTAGRNTYAIRTYEYRNGVLIGSVMKEIQVQSFTGQAPAPNNFTVGCGITMPTANNPLDLCIGQSISFCFSIYTTDTNTLLTISDNLSTAAPGATITYSGQGSHLINGTFSWTPTAESGGISNLVFTIVDSTCRPPGLLRYDAKLLPIRVWPKTNAGPDLLVCPNESVKLNATGGGLYNWTVLSGTPNSLSNTSIATPIASPLVTTTYAVVSNLNSFCANNKDTVTVDIRPSSMVTRPSINISVAPDSNISQGTAVTFTATTTNCNNPSYQWTSMGIDITGATNSSFTSNTIFDYESITCLLHCDDTCSAPRDTFSNAITIRIPTAIGSISKLEDKNIILFPNPNKGTFRIKLNKELDHKKPLQLQVINTVGQLIHTQPVTVNSGGLTEEIFIEKLPKGVYLLKLSNSVSTYKTSFLVTD